MKNLIAFIAFCSSPVWAQDTLPGLERMAVEVEQDGKRFICALREGDGVVVTDPCQPLMTPAQADQLSEATAQIEALGNSLNAALAQVATVTALAAGAQAEASSATEKAAELAAQLASAQAELAAAQEQLSGLDDLTYMAGLRALVIAVETNSVNVGLAAVGDALPLARASMDYVADTFGDGCTIPREVFRDNEAEIGNEIYARAMATLKVPENAVPLILSTHPRIDVFDDAAARFEAALDAALQAGDADTYDKGKAALKIAERALNKLDDAMSEAAQSPLVAKLTDDNTAIVLTKDACKG